MVTTIRQHNRQKPAPDLAQVVEQQTGIGIKWVAVNFAVPMQRRIDDGQFRDDAVECEVRTWRTCTQDALALMQQERDCKQAAARVAHKTYPREDPVWVVSHLARWVFQRAAAGQSQTDALDAVIERFRGYSERALPLVGNGITLEKAIEQVIGHIPPTSTRH